uniref:Wsv206-like protein n=1 Tax=Metapenaeus ensis nimavirus TaxID=2133794 RepID=A0A401IPE9_9VIRU|nr:MAG: wsv206-like protein [Metapenaeus ensis nimavirus]GBG35482.1 wsv206-like protein [Metapenaeus ensis nimavirus]
MKILRTEGGLLHPDILKNPENVICLQSNCVATKIHSESINDLLWRALGFGNPYEDRRPKPSHQMGWKHRRRNLALPEDRPRMGTIKVFQDDKKKCGLVCLFAQYNMGSGKHFYFSDKEYIDACHEFDGANPSLNRLKAFSKCLNELSSSPQIVSFKNVLFPYKIGCSRAGGNWSDYLRTLQMFDKSNHNLIVYIVIPSQA